MVIIELGVRPLPGCTLAHADDDSEWTIFWGHGPDQRLILTREMVAEALESRLNGYHMHGHGALWVFSEGIHALAFRAAMTEGESAS
jgi:hypothetical protein